MSTADKAKKAAKSAAKPKPASGSARKKMTGSKTAPVINPKPGGGFQRQGSISREQAALIMFGSKGAAERIAKANKKKS
jgi:hypothetical protein